MPEKSNTLTPEQEQLFAAGVRQMEAGNWIDAVTLYCRILKQRPDWPAAHYNLGVALTKTGKSLEATAAFRYATTLRPNFPEAWNNLGSMLREGNHPAAAVDALRRAVQLQPEFAFAWNNLAGALKDMGDLDGALAAFDRALALQPDVAGLHGGRLGTLSFHPAYDDPAIFAHARIWNDRFARPLAGEIRPHANERSHERRLRVGYVSPYFRNHCQSLFTPKVLQNHNHKEYQIYCYSDGVPDAVTARLQRHADVWRQTSGLDDRALAQHIRDDGIDILVDLTLHMAGSRLLVFARKPAPVQITWLGYTGTTGLDTIDYRLTDPQLDPPNGGEKHFANFAISGPPRQLYSGSADNPVAVGPQEFAFGIAPVALAPRVGIATKEDYYSELSVRLPDTFWCYDPEGMGIPPGAVLPNPGPLPARMAGHVTFGCLNNFCKVTDVTLALWARVLAAVPTAHLILMAPPGSPRRRVLDKLGVPEQRVEFVPFQSRLAYLQTYCRIDLCLDTIPVNGHTTSLDSFWMGVPVITRVGGTVMGRAGLSQLHNLGLLELAANTDEQYIQLASEWAADLDRLSRLRAMLRARMELSPLMDGGRFVVNLEAAYRMLWQTWCREGT